MSTVIAKDTTYNVFQDIQVSYKKLVESNNKLEETYTKINKRLKRKINGEKQQSFLTALIGTKIYYKLRENEGIVLDGDGRVVEFRVFDKDDNNLLEDGERKQLTFDIEKLKSLRNLTTVYLDETGVTGDIEHLKTLPNLTEIYFNKTGVTGNIENLKSLSNLTEIGLHETGVTGNIENLKSLPKLTWIGLYSTGVTGDIEHLKSLLNLTEIYLYNTGVSGNVVHLMKSLPNLTEFWLGNTVGDDVDE